MPIAVNDAGEALFLSDDGQWQSARIAENPQTKERLAFDGKDWQPIKTPKSAGDYGAAGGIVDAAAQGIPIVGPLLKKAGAAGAAVIQPFVNEGFDNTSFGQRYDANLAELDRRSDQFAKDRPVTSTTAGIAGGLASAIPLASTSAGATVLGLVGKTLPQQMAAGATSGAVIGGTDALLRNNDPFAAAGIGGVVGAAAPIAGRAVGKAVSGIKNAISPEANVATDLGRAIGRDNTTPEALMQRVQDLQKLRPGVATIADAGGENVRGLMERVAQTPGAGRTQIVPMLTVRQQGQALRVAGDLRSLTGTTKTAFEAVEEISAQQSKSAAPLYKKAYEAGDRAIWSPELERLSSSVSIQNAMRSGMKSWGETAVAEGYGAMNPGAMVNNGILKMFNGKVPTFPNLQFWDYTKRALDDQVSVAIRSGENQKARTLTALTKSLRDELDKSVPEFAAARNAWAGPAKFMDAIDEGRQVLGSNIGPEEFAARVATMSQSEREAARIGAVSAIAGKMGNDPAKLADMTKYLRSPNMRAKIAALMPTPEAQQKWMQRLDFEVSSSELVGRSLGNSATARRLAEAEDAKNIVGDLVMDAMTGGSSMGMLRKILGAGPKWLRDTLRSRADARLADVLTNPSPSTNDLLKAIRSQKQSSQGVAKRVTTGIRGVEPYLMSQ